MVLASFPLTIHRWKRSNLHRADYSKYSQLQEYMPKEVFVARLQTIDNHILAEYPHVWIDTYLFLAAVLLVIATAAFSVVANAAKLSMWYPLIILVIPAIIAFVTTRRRNRYYGRLYKYYESLQVCLKEINSLDVHRQVKWSFRRLRETDTDVNLHLRPPLSRHHINFVIDIVQVNTENELAEEGEMLPAYDTSMMDIVLDIGPDVQQAPGNRSEYIPMPSRPLSSNNGRITSPPAYDQLTQSNEPAQPPPAYANEQDLADLNPRESTRDRPQATIVNIGPNMAQ